MKVLAQAKKAYGSWKSPVTSDVVSKGGIRLGGLSFGRGNTTVWVEGRPSEGGRNVLVVDGTDLTPKDMNVRTRVHEYGGGAWKVLSDQNLAIFSDFKSQRLYKQSLTSGDSPEPLTPEVEGAALRFADFELDAKRNRILCVLEDHRGPSKEPVNSLAAIHLDTVGGDLAEPVQLVSGADFYSGPSLNSTGDKLAFVCWNHPSMPWDVTSVMVVDLSEEGLPISDPYLVAGGPDKEEAPQQPRWTPDGRLVYISDQDTGWWNLWSASFGEEEEEEEGKKKSSSSKKNVCLCPMDGCEFGGPPWMLGMKSYQILGDDKIVCSYSDTNKSGKTLAILTPSTGQLEEVKVPYQTFGSVEVKEEGEEGKLTFGVLGGSPVKPAEIAVQDTSGDWVVKKKASDLVLDESYLSEPQVIQYPSQGGRFSYMFYYPPKNPDYVGLTDEERPPLLVKTHGGPTAATSANFNPTIQYWTSRGFAVADVNYGGSTGYGRPYRELLKGTWGIVDVEDAAAAATYLADQGFVDPKRLAIDGGSAGGYTTLACLAFTDVFTAGCSLYGVASLEALAGDTHKFESRYLDYLVGPYPEKKEIYKERAPIENLEKLNSPLMLFQGLEDKIVPPNQAQMMYDICLEKKIPAALEMFEGEQHGFRKAENIRRCLDGEYDFFAQVFGFEPASLPEGFKHIKISNLK